MIGLDTNVLVRILVNDDPLRGRRALRLIQNEAVLVPKTVLVETEWVLRSAYGADVASIRAGFDALLAVATVEVEDRAGVERALEWYAAGLDFADALHLASSARAKAFATFDRDLAKRAARAGATPPTRAP